MIAGILSDTGRVLLPPRDEILLHIQQVLSKEPSKGFIMTFKVRNALNHDDLARAKELYYSNYAS